MGVVGVGGAALMPPSRPRHSGHRAAHAPHRPGRRGRAGSALRGAPGAAGARAPSPVSAVMGGLGRGGSPACWGSVAPPPAVARCPTHRVRVPPTFFPQGQQGPGGVRPDAPVGGVSRGADPPPDDRRGLLAAGGAARGGPRRPCPPGTHALAAPHPQPLHLDGGTLLRSVPPAKGVGAVGVGLARCCAPPPPRQKWGAAPPTKC